MIIRSQDKKKTTTDLNLEIIEPYNARTGKWDISSNTVGTIATYSTGEKALKVLDMIQNAYCKMKASDCLENGTLWEVAEVSEKEAKETIIEKLEFYSFQMPQDSEV